MWTYADGPAAGHPAITRHAYGQGTVWYISTRLDTQVLDAIIGDAANDARIAPPADLPRDVEPTTPTPTPDCC